MATTNPFFNTERRPSIDGPFHANEVGLANRNSGILLETLRHDLRMTYGPVALAENCLASDGWNEEPPVGSADFEAFVTNEGRQNADSAELVTPRTLGFEEEHVEPPREDA